MPLHRATIEGNASDALQAEIARLEKAGEAVVRFERSEDRGEWLILTRPPKNTRPADTVEYR